MGIAGRRISNWEDEDGRCNETPIAHFVAGLHTSPRPRSSGSNPYGLFPRALSVADEWYFLCTSCASSGPDCRPDRVRLLPFQSQNRTPVCLRTEEVYG